MTRLAAAALATRPRSAPARNRQGVYTVVSLLDGAETAALSHAELEERLDTDGRALLRRLLADHLELRAHREARVEVVDAGGVARGRVESGHGRALATVFGEVEVGLMLREVRRGRTPVGVVVDVGASRAAVL